MSEIEMDTLKNMGESFPKLTQEQKYYILGVGEGMALAKQMAQSMQDSSESIKKTFSHPRE